MTELDKLKRARMYIAKLADGIDPITDRELPEDTALNQVRLSRCFFYVSDVLRRVIENGGEIGSRRRSGGVFRITPEELAQLRPAPGPLTITQLCDLISGGAPSAERRLGYAPVTDWLTRKGFLRVEVSGGKKRRRATLQGEQVGILEEGRTGAYGEYFALLYSPEAQQFVMDNLPEILAEREDE